ncbi:MAG: restriction endonuclease [Candidatus Omnitrophica bacterium]|nr:restriction endonuclease [Candidatus Omnitrophota bacterium]
MPKSDLPFGSEFSPSQIDLKELLELANENSGNWKGFEKAVLKKYFRGHKTSDYNKRKLANNTKLGMIAYGIVDRNVNFTECGKRLNSIRNDTKILYEEFARHILLNLHGMTMVQCVQDMFAAGEDVNLIKLREWLQERGIHFPRGGKHPSMMRLWLEKAGVFIDGWRIDESKLKSVSGISSTDLESLAALTREQRAFLKTLANVGDGKSYASNEIEKLATTTYGVKFNEKGLPKDVLYPLEKAGYIHLERGTKALGRGAKPFVVKPTAKLISELITPLLQQLEKQTDKRLRPLLRNSLGDVLKDLKSKDRYKRGLALEALAFKLMRLLDLNYIATRLRGTATGGAEVDLIFESSRLVFSRWQVQCKNTAHVNLDDVAKEVGLTHLLKSNVIVMISTGQIGPEARRYANKIMTDSNLCVVMIDKSDVFAIEKNPSSIVSVFNREAAHAMKIKKLDI